MSNKLHVLVVDDNEMMAKTLKDILGIKGVQVEVAHSAPVALEKIEQKHFDCVLSDIKMPEVDGVELYRNIKAQQPNLPVVLMTAYATDKLIQEGLDEGVLAVLTKPLDMGRLLNFLTFLGEKPSVVIVDDDPAFGQTLGDVLQMHGFAVSQFTNPEGIEDALKSKGQTVLLDLKLQKSDSLDILNIIKNRYATLPVILVTDHREEMQTTIEAALNMGVDTCVYKPIQIDDLLQLLTKIYYQEMGKVLGRSFI